MTTTIGSIRDASHDSSWLTFTYAASNPDAQHLIADLLGNFHDIHVETTVTGGQPLVIVACPDAPRAESLHDVIMTLDWGARPTIAAVAGALTA
jgi:hypothetical protein